MGHKRAYGAVRHLDAVQILLAGYGSEFRPGFLRPTGPDEHRGRDDCAAFARTVNNDYPGLTGLLDRVLSGGEFLSCCNARKRYLYTEKTVVLSAHWRERQHE